MPDSRDMLSLAGRVAVVTGAGRGIGAATARLLAQAGARSRSSTATRPASPRRPRQIALEGGEALPFTNDVTDAFAVERTFDRVVEEWGRLDVLVNNAGALREAPLEELSDDDLQEMLDVNLRAAMVCARAAVPHMLAPGPRPHPLGGVGVDAPRRAGADRLRRGQGRHRRDDADLGARARPARDHRERGRARG